jgi:predicted nuclease of predicted toxin-antitoxin system
MNIKLDENLPSELVHLLVSYRHDIHTVAGESLVGQDDAKIFDAAVRESRMLRTQDMDFSDLRKFKPGTHPGLVIVRLRDPSRRRILERVQQVLETTSMDSWQGCFVVITDRKLRIRRA